jgi:hypothetical protein
VQLTLQQAVTRALATSEEVEMARQQRSLAAAQITQARAGALPQISGALVYNRTLASIFDNIQFGPEPEPGEDPPPNPFANLPFGQANTWNASLQIAQPCIRAGRVGTALQIARQRACRGSAGGGGRGGHRAAGAQRLLPDGAGRPDGGITRRRRIELADAQLRQVELFRQQGTASEFDVLRARVERDNLEPPIVEAQNARRLAELNLKRLINVPAVRQVIQITPGWSRGRGRGPGGAAGSAGARAALQALDEQSRHGKGPSGSPWRAPAVGDFANFAYQAFPEPGSAVRTDWRRDWSVSVEQVACRSSTAFRTRGTGAAGARPNCAGPSCSARRCGRAGPGAGGRARRVRGRRARRSRRAARPSSRRAGRWSSRSCASAPVSRRSSTSNARLLLQQAQVNEAQALYNYLNALARLERVSGGSIPLVNTRVAHRRVDRWR